MFNEPNKQIEDYNIFKYFYYYNNFYDYRDYLEKYKNLTLREFFIQFNKNGKQKINVKWLWCWVYWKQISYKINRIRFSITVVDNLSTGKTNNLKGYLNKIKFIKNNITM